MSVQPGKSQGSKLVVAKLPREEFTRFKLYSGQNGETTNATLRRLILTEIDRPRPTRLAGKSIFEYNKERDNFAWKIEMDEGSTMEVDSNLPASSIDQLLESLKEAVDERNSFIRRSRSESVPFPARLGRKRK